LPWFSGNRLRSSPPSCRNYRGFEYLLPHHSYLTVYQSNIHCNWDLPILGYHHFFFVLRLNLSIHCTDPNAAIHYLTSSYLPTLQSYYISWCQDAIHTDKNHKTFWENWGRFSVFFFKFSYDFLRHHTYQLYIISRDVGMLSIKAQGCSSVYGLQCRILICLWLKVHKSQDRVHPKRLFLIFLPSKMNLPKLPKKCFLDHLKCLSFS